MKERINRNSNYELMRIISMFLIVLYHVIHHGQVLENCQNEGLRIIVEFIKFFTIIHVNSYILITGYYQSQSKFKQSKIWSIINASLFYRITIMIILSLIGEITLDKLSIVRDFFPLDTVHYWFIKCYLFLYCLSPFLNKLVENITKKEFQKLQIVLFILLSIIPSLTGGLAFVNDGYTVYTMVHLYLIGAYLRKYPLKESYIFKPCSKNLFQLIMIFVFFITLIINYVLYKYSFTLTNINNLFTEIANNVQYASLKYSNPIIIIQSIAYFTFFGTLNIQSKFINKLSALTLEVYLIHENIYIRKPLYAFLKINNGPIYSYKYLIYMIMISILIYIACSLIGFIRQKVFKLIYNRKISQKVREIYYNYIKNFA